MSENPFFALFFKVLKSGSATIEQNFTAIGGLITAGVIGTTVGILEAASDGTLPGYIKIGSPDGTLHYLFVEDDATVKVHTAVPTANADGSAIGGQTD